jgi:hypothetical protein
MAPEAGTHFKHDNEAIQNDRDEENAIEIGRRMRMIMAVRTMLVGSVTMRVRTM